MRICASHLLMHCMPVLSLTMFPSFASSTASVSLSFVLSVMNFLSPAAREKPKMRAAQVSLDSEDGVPTKTGWSRPRNTSGTVASAERKRTFAKLAVADGCRSCKRLSGILEFAECFELYHLQMSHAITQHQHRDHTLSRNAQAQQPCTAAMHAPRGGGTLHSPSQLTPAIRSLCSSPATTFIILYRYCRIALRGRS